MQYCGVKCMSYSHDAVYTQGTVIGKCALYILHDDTVADMIILMLVPTHDAGM